MPKPINETIGKCPCPTPGCEEVADVRRLKNHERGRLYLVCAECGTLRPHGSRFQSYIEAHATLGTDPETVPEHEQEQAPAPVPEEKPRRGILGWLLEGM